MLDQARHRDILVSVLTDIYSNRKISHLLGFKGGTALYLFYNLNRFSVDLDFDLLEEDKGEEVHETLLEILLKHGSLKDQALKHFGSLISISYEKGLHHLKLDVSHREVIANYEVKQFLGLPMLVMNLKDMAANKLIALTDRKNPAARDVFDMFFILKNKIEINEAIIKNRTNLTLIEQLEKAISFIEKNFNANLLEALGELVEQKQKSWVKDKMKDETLMQLRIRLDSLQNSL
jgi:predicted nucleotidyltransferase component of viral defense system